VKVTKGKEAWTKESMGLTANANSQGPKFGLIWQRSVVKARMGGVALTDRRDGKPGRGLSETIVTEPGRSNTCRESADQRGKHKSSKKQHLIGLIQRFSSFHLDTLPNGYASVPNIRVCAEE
jgi:hypothetical protein